MFSLLLVVATSQIVCKTPELIQSSSSLPPIKNLIVGDIFALKPKLKVSHKQSDTAVNDNRNVDVVVTRRSKLKFEKFNPMEKWFTGISVVRSVPSEQMAKTVIYTAPQVPDFRPDIRIE